MTNSLSKLLHEMAKKFVDDHSSGSAAETLSVLNEWMSKCGEYTDEQSYLMAGYSLRLWNETLTNSSECEPKFILSVQDFVFQLIRFLRQFTTSEWLRIKCDIALTLGRKYSQLKTKSEFVKKAAACFEFVDEQLAGVECASFVNDRIRCMLGRIETVNEHDFQSAQSINERLQIVLKSLDKSPDLVTVKLYNVGLRMFQRQSYQQAVYWLNFSLENGFCCKFKEEICFLLADAYLALDYKLYWKTAEEILDKIDKDGVNNQTLNLLRLKASLANTQSSEDQLNFLLSRCCQDPIVSVAQMLMIVKCLMSRGYESLALEATDSWMKKTNCYLESKDDSQLLENLFECQMQMFLKDGQASKAETVLHGYLAVDGEKSSVALMDLAEGEAQRLMKEMNYNRSIEWLNYCVEMWNRLRQDVAADNEQRLTKYYQQIVSCSIQLKTWQPAEQLLTSLDTKVNDCNQIVTKCLKLQISIGRGNRSDAIECFKRISESCSAPLTSEDEVFKLLLNCIKFGIHSSQLLITLSFVQMVIEAMDSNSNVILCLMELLLKLKIATAGSTSEADDVQWYENFGCKVFQLLTISTEDAKARWFVKVLWNVAHDNRERQELVYVILRWSNRILGVCQAHNKIGVVLQRKTCILLAAAAAIKTARKQPSKHLLNDVIDLIDEYRQLDIVNCAATEKASKSADRLISLYEFEAKCGVDAPSLEDIFNSCFNWPEIDAKYLEILAAIAYKVNVEWSMRCLASAINALVNEAQPDYVRIGQLYHNLVFGIITLIQSGKSDVGQLEAAMSDIQNLIESCDEESKEKFPEKELAWLVCRCWNLGVERLTEDAEGAHTCCVTAMKMALHLGIGHQTYLERMNAAYPTVMKSWSAC